MLSLEKPPFQAGGLTVFTDHADDGHFYYAAPNPEIAVSGGRPMFDVFSYAVELKQSPLAGTTIPAELGAGFLTMGADCALTPAARTRVLTDLANQTGRDPQAIALAPIPYIRGGVSVLALDAATGTAAAAAAPAATPGRPQFVLNVVGGGTPSLLGDLRSIFSLSLSQDGVVFLQGLYADGAAPVGIVYDLTFLGLRPGVEAHVHAETSKIYEEFGGKASVGCAYFRAEVEDTISKMRQKGDIDIQLTSQATGEAAAKAEELAMSLFRDRIIQALFQPAATPQIPNFAIPGMPSTTTQPSLVSVSLKMKKDEELRTIDYDFSERSPEERTHAPQGFLTALLDKNQLAEHIHHIDLGSPFFELLEVLVTGPTDEEFAALSLRSVTADLTYGGAGDAVPPETQSLVFRAGSSGDKTWAVKRRGRPTLAYTVDVTYEFSPDGSVDADSLTYRTGPRPRTGRTLSLRPYDDLSVIDVEVELGRVPDSVKDVDVTLNFNDVASGFTAKRDLRLTLGQQLPAADRHWQVRTQKSQAQRAYTATAVLTFDDGAVLPLPAIASTEPLLRVDGPFTATRNLLIQPNVTAPDVSAVTVEINYDDEKAGYHRHFVQTLTPQVPTVEPGTPPPTPAPAPSWQPLTLAWPIIDADLQKVRYRITTAAGGVVDAGQWTETDEPSFLVGDVGHRKRHVDVRLVGPTLADVGLDAVTVRVGIPGGAEADAVSLFFDASTTTPQSIDLPAAPDAPPGVRFQTTGFHTDGSQRQSAWTDSPNLLLVLSTRTI